MWSPSLPLQSRLRLSFVRLGMFRAKATLRSVEDCAREKARLVSAIRASTLPVHDKAALESQVSASLEDFASRISRRRDDTVALKLKQVLHGERHKISIEIVLVPPSPLRRLLSAIRIM